MKQYEIEVTRKYTVFVDAENEDEAINYAEANYDELTHGIADLMTADILSVDGKTCAPKDEWYAITRWCDEDIAINLRDMGFADTPENIALIRDHVDTHWFTDLLVERGLESMTDSINWNSENLTRIPAETITGFFIDPENNIAEERTIPKTLDAYYNLLRCDTIDIVSRVIGGECYDIICDDEALLKENPVPSAIDHYNNVALCNPIFIVNYDGGDDVCSLHPDDIAALRTHIRTRALVDADFKAITCIYGLC